MCTHFWGLVCTSCYEFVHVYYKTLKCLIWCSISFLFNVIFDIKYIINLLLYICKFRILLIESVFIFFVFRFKITSHNRNFFFEGIRPKSECTDNFIKFINLLSELFQIVFVCFFKFSLRISRLSKLISHQDI